MESLGLIHFRGEGFSKVSFITNMFISSNKYIIVVAVLYKTKCLQVVTDYTSQLFYSRQNCWWSCLEIYILFNHHLVVHQSSPTRTVLIFLGYFSRFFSSLWSFYFIWGVCSLWGFCFFWSFYIIWRVCSLWGFCFFWSFYIIWGVRSLWRVCFFWSFNIIWGVCSFGGFCSFWAFCFFWIFYIIWSFCTFRRFWSLCCLWFLSFFRRVCFLRSFSWICGVIFWRNDRVN